MSRISSYYIILDLCTYAPLNYAYDNNLVIPEWFSKIVYQCLNVDISGQRVRDAVVLRKPSYYDYAVASWELNMLCDYECHHCYLGNKTNVCMTLSNRKKVIKRMQELGVIYLQLTGGEPLIDKHFAESYAFAYDSGIMLTVSTNGSWLHKGQILSLFEDRPPLRVTVSLYGATNISYEAMTNTLPGTFNNFLYGLECITKKSIALRVNIIVSSYNEHEVNAMKYLASRYTNEVIVYDKMSASIYGKGFPLEFQATNHRNIDDCHVFEGCEAGVKSFHVDPVGKASMCKMSREHFIQLNCEPAIMMSSLAYTTRLRLTRSGECENCEMQSKCTTCPIIVENYRSANADKLLYCKRYALRR